MTLLNRSKPGLHQNLSQRLSTTLGIQPDESHAFWLLMGHAFFIGIAMVSFYVPANAIFLAVFEAEVVSYTYVVSAVITILIGFSFNRLQTRLSFGHTLLSVTGFLLISVLGLRLGLWLTNAPWLAFLFMVWVRLLWTLVNLEIFALAGRLVTVRQGKRLFPLMTASVVLAVILFGLSTSILIDALGTVNLLWLTAGSLLLVLGFLVLTIRAFPGQIETGQSQATPTPQQVSGRAIFKDGYARLVLAFVFLVGLGARVADFAFITQASQRFTDVDELGNFFGNFLGVSTLINLLFLVLVAGRILNRYGIKVGLIARPGLVGLGAFAVAAATLVLAPVTVIFWLVVATRLFDEITDTGMMNSSLQILYQVLPPNRRVLVQTAVETAIKPLAMGLSGLLLIGLTAWATFSVIHTIYLLLLIMIGGGLIAIFLARQYPIVLQKALTRRFLGQDVLSLADQSSIDVLLAQLESPHWEEVTFVLNILSQTTYNNLESILVSLVTHPSPEVRQYVLQKIEADKPELAREAIKRLIAQEEIAAIKGEGLRALCALGSTEIEGWIEPYLDDPQPQVRVGVIVGMLRYGGLPQAIQAGHRLLHMMESADSQERILAATIIGQVGHQGFYPQIMTLSADPETAVQQAALQAAGQLNHPRLWPLVLAQITHPQLGETAMKALMVGGETILPAIEAALTQPDLKAAYAQRLFKLCGRIGGDKAAALLKSRISTTDPSSRLHLLAALSRCRYQAPEEALPPIWVQIQTEITYAGWLLASWADISHNAHTDILQAALTAKLEACRTRLFYLLSFTHDTQMVLRIQDNLGADAKEKQAYAQEMLDIILPKEMKAILLPWLLDMTPEQRWQRLQASLPPALTQEQRLQWLMEMDEERVDSWVSACAIYVVGRLGKKSLLAPVVHALSSEAWLLRETAVWTLAKLATPNWEARVSPLRHDSHPQVRQFTQHILEPSAHPAPKLLTIEKVRRLKTVTIFSRIPDHVLVEVAAGVEELFVPAGTPVFAKGSMGHNLYIVISGKVRVHDGEQFLNDIEERGIFGEMAALSPAPRMASVTVVVDARLLRLSQETLRELIDDHREVAHGLIQVLSQRLRLRSAALFQGEIDSPILQPAP